MGGTGVSVELAWLEDGAKASSEDCASSLSFRFLLRTDDHAGEASSTLPSLVV